MGGLVRCGACGEVHWNLRLAARPSPISECRLCGAELRPEPRRPRRRFDRLMPDRADALPGKPAEIGPGAGS
jgi:hypothetical protein